MKLIGSKPKRLFTFGCSFTKYNWPTWANIVALDLDIPLYNYGRSGAGNQFMFNMLMQADNYFHINQDDLVMISWTNFLREDRWIDGWITPGNIFTQKFYNEEFVDKYVNETHCILRDFAVIKAAYEFLQAKSCQFHFLKMINFENICQFSNKTITTQSTYERLYDQFEKYLKFVQPSFYDILWCGNVQNKLNLRNDIHSEFTDAHPTIPEHFQYLKTVFNEHNFLETTEETITKKHEEFASIVRHLINKKSNLQMMQLESLIKPSEKIMFI